MYSFTSDIPAYGMPDTEGPVCRPEPAPPMPPPPDMDGQHPMMPPMDMRMPTGNNRGKASPPLSDPLSDPNTVPGSDLKYEDGFPGFPGSVPPQVPPFDRVESIDIIGGKYCPCGEPYAQITGEIGDSSMENLIYRTDRPCLNGAYISDSRYTVKGCDFRLQGNGVNDFAGIGAGLMTDGTSDVVIQDTTITTDGVLRSCLAATGNSNVTVKNCTLTANGGPVPDTYVPRIGAGMVIPPPGVDVGGTCRTFLSMGQSKTYFHHCRLISNGWAVMSTDCCAPGQYMEVNDSEIYCRDSGYGTFGDHDTHNVFNRTYFRVYDYIAISGSSSKLEFNDCDMNSVKYGAMIFGNTAAEMPEIWMRGGALNVVYSGVHVKGSNAFLYFDGVKLKTMRNIVSSVYNDDPLLAPLDKSLWKKDFGVKAVLRNMDADGDLINSNHTRDMAVLLQNSSVRGAVSGCYLSLERADWFATDASDVCLVGAVDLSGMDAATDTTIHAFAGKGCTLSGKYHLPSGGMLVVDMLPAAE